MQASVLATSHYLQAIHADALPSLSAALADACRIRLRRVDRFVQLAVIGSARCAAGQALAADCGVYMASALGPVGSNTRVHENMLRDRSQPRPFDFINTLGGSAGFYIASNLELAGPHMFTGSDQALLAAMAGALLDLDAGVVSQALVGVVEEAPPPMPAQRQRLHLSADATIAEGSHWWLLGQPETRGMGQIALQSHDGAADLDARLDAMATPDLRLACSRDLAPACTDRIGHQYAPVTSTRTQAALPAHGSTEAAWLARAMTADAHAPAALVGRNRLLHYRA